MPKQFIKADASSRLNPYEDLANGIVAQAIMDYRDLRRGVVNYVDNGDGDVGLYNSDAQRELEKNPARKAVVVQAQKQRIVDFIKSRWFVILTNLDPKYVLHRLETEPIIRDERRLGS